MALPILCFVCVCVCLVWLSVYCMLIEVGFIHLGVNVCVSVCVQGQGWSTALHSRGLVGRRGPGLA